MAVTKDTAVRHNSALVEAISQATGISRRTIRRGLDDLINAGHLARDARGYLAIMKTDPPLIRRGVR